MLHIIECVQLKGTQKGLGYFFQHSVPTGDPPGFPSCQTLIGSIQGAFFTRHLGPCARENHFQLCWIFLGWGMKFGLKKGGRHDWKISEVHFCFQTPDHQ